MMDNLRSTVNEDGTTPFRPDLLTVARQSRKLTQKQLASLTGISQPTISRLEEAGEPTDDQADRLASVLEYPVTFFYRSDPIYGFGVGELFHRRRKQIPAKTLDAIHAEINIRRMAVTRLLKAIDLPELQLPSVDRDDPLMTPEDAARVLRARWLVPKGPVPSVSQLLERAGILIIPGRFETTLVDAIGIWPLQSPPMIFVNKDVPQDRLRLTLMHEVGHFVLHSGWGLNVDEGIETEANRFAAEFLAPAEAVAPQLRDLNLTKLAQLKRHWKISMGALLLRAKELGTVTERRYQSLWTEMGKLGYRTREPKEFDVRAEEPGASFTELLRIYREELQYSSGEIAQIAGLLPHRFQEDYLQEDLGPKLIRAIS